MKFQLRPVLTEIKELYQKPISPERFKEYLQKSQGDSKNDMILPIAGFNPMAKNHLLVKIEELEVLKVEELMTSTIEQFNCTLEVDEDMIFKVVLNLADDMKGAWTNHYTTDFDSKFKLNAFVSRKFCVPYFWTNENYTETLIQNRTNEYLNRTLYWIYNGSPKTLEDHYKQEMFAVKNSSKISLMNTAKSFDFLEAFYQKHKNNEDYDLIFNFFYGDEACDSLGYKKYGVGEMTGSNYVRRV